MKQMTEVYQEPGMLQYGPCSPRAASNDWEDFIPDLVRVQRLSVPEVFDDIWVDISFLVWIAFSQVRASLFMMQIRSKHSRAWIVGSA